MNILFTIALIILSVGLLFLYWKLKSIQRKVSLFFQGNVENLEDLIIGNIERLKKSERLFEELYKNHNLTRELAKKGLHKIGFVRFNPFKEIGGDQSFSVAFLDYDDNGLIISSLHNREGTRLFAKPLQKGISSHQLTKEEELAIKKANGED